MPNPTHKAIIEAKRIRGRTFQEEEHYLVEIHEEGDLLMSGGDTKRMVHENAFIYVATLSEIPDLIGRLIKPYWWHRKLELNLSKEEQKAIPFEEKRWGVLKSFKILKPLGKEVDWQEVVDAEDRLYLERHYRAEFKEGENNDN